jgi:hypothetical protein
MLGEFKWRLVHRVSRVLEPDERNAVLGDVAEPALPAEKPCEIFSVWF